MNFSFNSKLIEITNSYLYNSVAILVASDIFRQSINQNRADTVVVNETQSFTNVNGVEPVTSSHCARDGPPLNKYLINWNNTFSIEIHF